jgi:ABC-2 type transport system permease protein
VTGFRALLGKELLESWRTYRLLAVVVVGVLVGIVSPLTARYIKEIIGALGSSQLTAVIPDPVPGDAVDQLLKNLGQFGGLLAILIAMGSVASEKERGSAGFVLTKPATRAAFLAAKVVTIGFVLLAGVAAAGALAWTYTTILFEPLPVAGFAAACLLAWLGLAAIAAVTFLASAALRSAVAAAGIGFAFLIIDGILGVLPGIGNLLPGSLSVPARAVALGLPSPDLVPATLVSVAVVAVALALAWAAFRRQEL